VANNAADSPTVSTTIDRSFLGWFALFANVGGDIHCRRWRSHPTSPRLPTCCIGSWVNFQGHENLDSHENAPFSIDMEGSGGDRLVCIVRRTCALVPWRKQGEIGEIAPIRARKIWLLIGRRKANGAITSLQPTWLFV
jgi:hypothetical protein